MKRANQKILSRQGLRNEHEGSSPGTQVTKERILSVHPLIPLGGVKAYEMDQRAPRATPEEQARGTCNEWPWSGSGLVG